MDGCTPELMMRHSAEIAENKQSIKGIRDDVDRHEKVYDILLRNTETQTEMLGEIKLQGAELKTQGEVLSRVVGDVDYLKENAQTKATVQRLWDEVDILKAQDGEQALKTMRQIKWLLITLLLGAMFTLFWGRVIEPAFEPEPTQIEQEAAHGRIEAIIEESCQPS